MSQNRFTLHLVSVVSSATRPMPQLRLVSDDESVGSRTASGMAAKEPSDAELVAQLQARQAGAFEKLYRRHAPFVINLAFRVQGNGADVEDILHDAFLKAHDRIAELRDASAFRGWLGSIVVMLVRGRLRRRRLLGRLGVHHGDSVELDAIASEQAGPECRAELAQVYALLQTLPTDDRIAWTLRVIERQSLDEVAQMSDCSLATAKRRIGRAQKFLEKHFVAPFTEDQP